MRSHWLHIILFLLAIFPLSVSAVEIVRMNIQIGENQYNLDLELYDSITPVTVTNFLNYVGDVGSGSYRYDQSFVQRSVTNSFMQIIQGGGFTFDPILGGFEYDPLSDSYPGGFQPIPEDLPIVNEFIGSGLSNVRGTIAMARGAYSDSATSQWFINQKDNTLLDNESGYAVFGRILDNGMDIVDQIGAVPIYNLSSFHSAFQNLPLDNYISGDPVMQENLIRINTVMVIQRPILKSDIEPIDFASVLIGDTAQKTVTLSNTGNVNLDIDETSLAAMVAPFKITSETCSNTILSPANGTCSVTIEFSPVTAGSHQGDLVITPSVNPLLISASLAVEGEGVLDIPNRGDANNDNIQDDAQNNVTTVLTDIGMYATIVSAPGTLLHNVSVVSNPSPEDTPIMADFRHGMFQYNITDSSSVVTVGVLMPVDDNSNTYYKYGSTPDNPTPHWYDFSFDGSTGAQHVGKVEIKNPVDGSIVNRNMFVLSYIDGHRGDDDVTFNGEIVSTGAISSVATSTSGSSSWYWIVITALLLKIMRLSAITRKAIT